MIDLVNKSENPSKIEIIFMIYQISKIFFSLPMKSFHNFPLYVLFIKQLVISKHNFSFQNSKFIIITSFYLPANWVNLFVHLFSSLMISLLRGDQTCHLKRGRIFFTAYELKCKTNLKFPHKISHSFVFIWLIDDEAPNKSLNLHLDHCKMKKRLNKARKVY